MKTLHRERGQQKQTRMKKFKKNFKPVRAFVEASSAFEASLQLVIPHLQLVKTTKKCLLDLKFQLINVGLMII